MPNKHFYFAMGAANGAIISYFVRRSRYWLSKRFKIVRRLYRFDRDWFLFFPFFIGLMGAIALIPDILHGLNILSKDTTRGPLFNIFYFHSYFERLEDANQTADWIMNSLGSLFFLLLSIGIFIFYIREIKRIKNRNQQE